MQNCHLNVHFLPFIPQCAFCNIKYTAVGRLETLQEDLLYIGEMAGVEFKMISTNPSSGGSTSELAGNYFRQLDLRTVKKLYELYKVDFEMFGYSPDSYFNMAKKWFIFRTEKTMIHIWIWRGENVSFSRQSKQWFICGTGKIKTYNRYWLG